MAHQPDPTVTLHQAPPSPADDLAASCASTGLKAFTDSGFDVDCVQVYAFRRGKLVAGWTALGAKRGER